MTSVSRKSGPKAKYAPLCSIPGRGRRHQSKGYCSTHYRRQKLGLPMLDPIGRPPKTTCSHPSCDLTEKYAGLCSLHYYRHLRGQDMDAPLRRRSRETCSVGDCENPYDAAGFCNLHYKRAREGRDMDATPQVPGWFQGCMVGDCTGKHESRGLCRNHARTMRNYKMSPIQLVDSYLLGCQICGATENLHIDHDHTCCKTHRNTCGKCIRGVLCGSCNNGLGNFKDSPRLMSNAIHYLLGE